MQILMTRPWRDRCYALAVACALAGTLAGTAGCGVLDVSDPTRLENSELDNAEGANLLRRAALKQLVEAINNGFLADGILSDELFSDPPGWYEPQGLVSTDRLLDQRRSLDYENVTLVQPYFHWQDLRRKASVALDRIRAYSPAGAREAHIGEMFAVRGFAEIQLAEDFCSGFPLHDLAGLTPVYRSPLTTDEVFQRALADFDSAAFYGADSARILDFARIGRGRALLGLGQFADAGAAVADVPDGYVYATEYFFGNGTYQTNRLSFNIYDFTRGVANAEGGNGLDYVAADDPRVVVDSMGLAADSTSIIYRIGKYPTELTPVILASKIEARLIQAEAALAAGSDTWIDILNELRAGVGLSDLPDPVDPAARVDLLFRERAFWLFATGHRLGDMRRLLARYQRPAEEVFPTGPYHIAGVFGTATSIPYASAYEAPFTPGITGCASR